MSLSKVSSLAVALLMLAWSGSALAEPADAKTQAEAKVVEALRLFQRGDSYGSLDRLIEAQSLFPSPKLQFNFGVVYRSLGRDVEALEAFEAFLINPADAPALRTTEAQREVAELRSRVAFIEVASDTDGAEVYVDGRSYGKTPLGESIAVAPGPHQVLIEKEGVPLPYTDRIETRVGSRVRVQAPLARLAQKFALQVRDAEPKAWNDRVRLKDEGRAEPPKPPVYRRWWFWTGAVVVVAGTVTFGILASRPSGAPICSDCNGGVIVLH
jgi:hypothetical protein